MTISDQPAATTAEGFTVDASVKYEIDAGQCEACGYFKTWKYKVPNKKSGKMMPGHVTADGFKIGEGDCPKWAKIADMNKKKAEKRASGTPGAPQAPGTWIKEIVGVPAGAAAASVVNSPAFVSGQALMAPGKPNGVPDRVAPAPQASQAPPGAEPGHVIAFTVNGFTITTSMTQAASVVEQIGVALRKALGTGA